CISFPLIFFFKLATFASQLLFFKNGKIMTTQQTGKRAEQSAVEALEKAGYVILDRNWRCANGEIDIIARQNAEIVFVEVRSRIDGTTAGIEAALESVGRGKQTRLIRLAQTYLDSHNFSDSPCRIDVVAVSLPVDTTKRPLIEIVENAIGW